MKCKRTCASAAWLLGLALLMAPATTQAADYSVTDLQFLMGGPFDDAFYGIDTVGGAMATLRLQHFSTWSYGDNFVFIDFYHGDFRGPDGGSSGQSVKIYGEVRSRLSAGKVFRHPRPFMGIFKDVFLAGEIDRAGNGAYGYLLGLSADFNLPSPYIAGITASFRYDKYVKETWQVTPYWIVPFEVSGMNFLFNGYADIAGIDGPDGSAAVDIAVQPQLMLDLLGLTGRAPGKLYGGLSVFFHRYPGNTVIAPQYTLRWIL
jgi:nucleoside-specific outer membrane channel protein Tsx